MSLASDRPSADEIIRVSSLALHDFIVATLRACGVAEPQVQSVAKALTTASPLMRPFLRSRYFRFLAQHHFLHHKYVHCNYNLLLGGDLVWQRQRYPSREDYREMQALGLYVAPRHLSELSLAQP